MAYIQDFIRSNQALIKAVESRTIPDLVSIVPYKKENMGAIVLFLSDSTQKMLDRKVFLLNEQFRDVYSVSVYFEETDLGFYATYKISVDGEKISYSEKDKDNFDLII